MKAIELDAQLNTQKGAHIIHKQLEKDKVKSESFLNNAVKESMRQNKALQTASIK